jgi:hypothetical protein
MDIKDNNSNNIHNASDANSTNIEITKVIKVNKLKRTITETYSSPPLTNDLQCLVPNIISSNIIGNNHISDNITFDSTYPLTQQLQHSIPPYLQSDKPNKLVQLPNSKPYFAPNKQKLEQINKTNQLEIDLLDQYYIPSKPPVINEFTESSSITKLSYSFDKNKLLVKLFNQFISTDSSIDIVLLFDVSGSMRSYYDNLSNMMMDIITRLTQYDRICFCTFATRAIQHFPLEPVIAKARQEMLQKVKCHQSWDGTTNLQSGIALATAILIGGKLTQRTTHFIVVTDGKADQEKEGFNEMIELLKIPNLIVHMCTFGNNINSSVFTNVLSEDKISDYVHLDTIDDFSELITSIGKDKLSIVADKITLCISSNDIIISELSIAQLRTNDEIMLPILIDESIDLTNIFISIKYTDNKGNEQILDGQIDESLQDLICFSHERKRINDQLKEILEGIDKLKIDSTFSFFENNDLTIEQNKLNEIFQQITEQNVGIFKNELVSMHKIINDRLNMIKIGNTEREQSISNTATMCMNRMYSGRSQTSSWLYDSQIN